MWHMSLSPTPLCYHNFIIIFAQVSPLLVLCFLHLPLALQFQHALGLYVCRRGFGVVQPWTGLQAHSARCATYSQESLLEHLVGRREDLAMEQMAHVLDGRRGMMSPCVLIRSLFCDLPKLT